MFDLSKNTKLNKKVQELLERCSHKNIVLQDSFSVARNLYNISRQAMKEKQYSPIRNERHQEQLRHNASNKCFKKP